MSNDGFERDKCSEVLMVLPIKLNNCLEFQAGLCRFKYAAAIRSSKEKLRTVSIAELLILCIELTVLYLHLWLGGDSIFRRGAINS